MPEISCFTIRNFQYNHGYPTTIMFIKYDKYFIVKLNSLKSIIILYRTLLTMPYLYKLYIISLLLTENTNKIDYLHLYREYAEYAIRTKIYYKILGYTNDYEHVIIGYKNPLNKNEPVRETSNRKIKKFIRNYRKIYVDYLLIYNFIDMFVIQELKIVNIPWIILKIKKRDCMIEILTGIKKKYGNDLYDNIRKYL